MHTGIRYYCNKIAYAYIIYDAPERPFPTPTPLERTESCELYDVLLKLLRKYMKQEIRHLCRCASKLFFLSLNFTAV